MYQCLSVYTFLCFSILCFSLQEHLSLPLLSHYLAAHSLALSVLLPFMLCVPCPFNAPFLFSVFQLLHPPPSTHLNPSQQQQLHLFSVMHIYSLCAPCACYLAMLLHALSMSSALPDHHCNSSSSLAVKPMRPSSLGVMLRFLHLSSSRDSLSSLLQSSSTSLLQLQDSTLFHLSIASMTSLHSTGRFLETLHLLWQSHRSLFESSGRNHQWFLVVTVRTLRWSLAMLVPSTYVTTGGDHQLIRHFSISTFRHSTIQNSCDQVSRHSKSRSPKWSLVALAPSSIFRRCDHWLIRNCISQFRILQICCDSL
jgi:hypothetical protein